jgi:hypothetical protein
MTTKNMEVKSKVVIVDQRFDLCTFKSFSGMLLKSFSERILETSNIKFGCPYKKNSVIKIKAFKLSGLFFPPIFKPEVDRSISLVMSVGKNATPILSLVMNYMKVMIDD